MCLRSRGKRTLRLRAPGLVLSAPFVAQDPRPLGVHVRADRLWRMAPAFALSFSLRRRVP
jgi:hypothetical protein